LAEQHASRYEPRLATNEPVRSFLSLSPRWHDARLPRQARRVVGRRLPRHDVDLAAGKVITIDRVGALRRCRARQAAPRSHAKPLERRVPRVPLRRSSV
jgi:hypothetical protein